MSVANPDLSSFSLASKTAVVTGANTGIGQAIAVVQTTGQLHHFAQSVQHLHMAVGDPGDDQVETVGTQIDGGDDVGRHGNFPFNPA